MKRVPALLAAVGAALVAAFVATNWPKVGALLLALLVLRMVDQGFRNGVFQNA